MQAKAKTKWDRFRFVFGGWMLLAFILAFFGGLIWFDIWLYFHRHPDASWWTYLFKH